VGIIYTLKRGLLKIISQNLDHFKRIEDIMLSINIDGVPLFKSSGIPGKL
jgi:hypothetical protein